MRIFTTLFLICFPHLAIAEATAGYGFGATPSRVALIAFMVVIVAIYLFLKFRSNDK